jgi:hypothetical protein
MFRGEEIIGRLHEVSPDSSITQDCMTADQLPDMNELKVATSLSNKIKDPLNSNGLRPIGQDSVTSI